MTDVFVDRAMWSFGREETNMFRADGCACILGCILHELDVPEWELSDAWAPHVLPEQTKKGLKLKGFDHFQQEGECGAPDPSPLVLAILQINDAVESPGNQWHLLSCRPHSPNELNMRVLANRERLLIEGCKKLGINLHFTGAVRNDEDEDSAVEDEDDG